MNLMQVVERLLRQSPIGVNDDFVSDREARL